MKSRKTKLLILDFNNLLFRYLNIHSDLSFHGKKTGGVYGFLSQICHQVNKHEPDFVVAVNDVKPYKRSSLFPNYKKNHTGEFDQEKHDLIRQSKEYCRDLLEALHIPLWEEEGYEADDLIAILVYKYKYRIDEIIIVSNDDDLYSLLYPNVCIQRNKEIVTYRSFIHEYDIHPSSWSEILAMCGTHNGIPNLYNRLGIKTALKIYKDPKKMRELLDKYEQEFVYNLALILLPIDFGVDFIVPKRTAITIIAVEKMLINTYGITITNEITDCLMHLNHVALWS